MPVSMIVSVVAYALSSLGFLAFSAGFGLRREWEPWHGRLVGCSWAELSEPLRVVLLSLMRVAAAGGAALAITTAALTYALATGDPRARWLLPAVTLAFAVPAALVAVRFGRSGDARPPLGPAVAGVALPVVGWVASLL